MLARKKDLSLKEKGKKDGESLSLPPLARNPAVLECPFSSHYSHMREALCQAGTEPCWVEASNLEKERETGVFFTGGESWDGGRK